MSNVIPFPRSENRPFVTRHAARMAGFKHRKGEDHLQRLLRQHIDTMRRRGIHEDAIAGEARAVESAIRAALWRAIITPGGAA